MSAHTRAGFFAAALGLFACGGNVVVDHGGSDSGGGSPSSSGSHSSGASSSSSLSCEVAAGGVKTCVASSDASSIVETAIDEECSQQHGTLGHGCSTDGVVGCCQYAMSGIELLICYYDGAPLSEIKQTCEGIKGKFTSSPP